jgi:chlorite dismutase
MTERMFTIIGGANGPWRVARIEVVAGDALERVARLDVVNHSIGSLPNAAKWMLRGVTSNERYTTRHEVNMLIAKQPALGRPEATCAALIPVKKSASWWGLAQDERRAIFAEQSEHIKIGLRYLPAVARRLHHCRDLGEPFDFLTWFEYAPSDSAAFEELVAILRRSQEWGYVEREVDIRLVRDVAA